ncbi:MAG: hypothetical protein EU532_14575 [Promethearchaeota archaeon]|nr:MAG: hypothetical protein EU532_14575 [Candidatus Lokiarchaeota archaeon]
MNIITIPGWVDLQVNGYKGVNFSDPSLALEDIHTVSSELLKNGTIAYCPTIISSPLEVYQHNLPLIADAMRQNSGAEILGAHIEGPFINPEEGVRGIHLKNNIFPPIIETFKKILNWSKDIISIITLAPEIQGSIQLIEYIVNNTDIIVSVGHSMAKSDDIKAAIEAGAKAATHVGNGIPPYIPRHNNPLWSILAEERIYGLFITDGFHIPPDFIKVCLKAKGINKFIVTSDLTHFAGLKPGPYSFYNTKIILEINGFIHKENSELLAGSTKTMMECMNYVASILQLNEIEYYKIGFENPLKLINKTLKNNKFFKIVFQNNKFHLINEY